MVRETNNEASMAQHMVMARGLNNMEVNPCT